MTEFEQELKSLINRCSLENGSDTPDWMLAEYLINCLEVFNNTIRAREEWYGRDIRMSEDNEIPTIEKEK